MFGKKKKKKEKKRRKKNVKNVGTVISAGTKINGVIKVEESIRIDGKLEGELIVENGDIFIGKEGELEADIKGNNIMIAGKVRGDVMAKNKLEIVETGELIGDISISNLIIQDGAVFKGNSTCEVANKNCSNDIQKKKQTTNNSKKKTKSA